MSRGASQTSTVTPLLPEDSKLVESGNLKQTHPEQENISYPKGVFFIITNTFCERFSFNGIRAVLPLYIRNILLYDEDEATVIFHGLSIVCFLFPIIGGIISDSYLGNFKTILYFSILYAVGSVLLPIAAIPDLLPQIAFSTLALFIIHVGTGGIKPCISAFGGEQFVCPQQSNDLGTFFSIFYIVMNAGALIAVFITPILRDDVNCFGESSCFALAFGLNGAILLFALVIFAIGKSFYKIKKPHRSIITDFCGCIWRGLRLRFTAKTDKHDHWLDYASDRYDKQLIEDVKQVLSVIVVFIPMPVFWALYEQQNTRWTFQATRMNGDLGGWVVKPEQMQIVNPIFTILFIPLFDRIIYPLFKKCGLLTPLQRIGSGLIFCGIAFIISAFVEMSLEPTYATIPGDGFMKLNFINTLPCDVEIRYKIGAHSANLTLDQNDFVIVDDLPADEAITILKSIATGEKCNLLSTELGYVDLGRGNHRASYSVLITQDVNDGLAVFRMNREEKIEKSFSGDPLLGFFHVLRESTSYQEGEISLKQGDNVEVNYYYNTTSEATPTSVDYVVQTEFREVKIRDHDVYLSGYDGPIGKVENLIQGGVYRVVISPSFDNSSSQSLMSVPLTPPNTLSILWLLPQIVVMTIAEILFAVTQMTFSFTEAPARMKSVMQAISLLIIAVGNLIVIIVAEAKSELSQRNEFFLFAGIIGLATVIFAMLSMQYRYVVQHSQEQQQELMTEKQSKKK